MSREIRPGPKDSGSLLCKPVNGVLTPVKLSLIFLGLPFLCFWLLSFVLKALIACAEGSFPLVGQSQRQLT